MESEHSQNFNERLGQWVASQGFWFQLRHSLAGGGVGGNLTLHLMRLAARLLVFLIVIAIAGGIYLDRRTKTDAFNEGIKESLKSGLNASEIEIRGLNRAKGELGINGITCKAGNGTFFSSLEARNVRCKMSFLDGLIGKWNLGTVSISRLDLNLRAGADDEESSQLLGDTLFKQLEKVDLTSLVVADATLRWGYGKSISPKSAMMADPQMPMLGGYESEHTQGMISNTSLRLQRVGDEFRLSLTGGKFTQNWLQNLDILDMEVVCDRNGIRFERASFQRQQGSVNFAGLTVVGGARPQVDGTVVVRNLPIAGMLSPMARRLVQGTISGDFRVAGSTNSSEGISFEGGVSLSPPDTISLNGRLPLLQALSVVDFSRNYPRIDFNAGSFHLKVSGGGMTLTDLHLKSEDQTTLDGTLNVRLPTYEEARSFVEKGNLGRSARLLESGGPDLEIWGDGNDTFNLGQDDGESNSPDGSGVMADADSFPGNPVKGAGSAKAGDQSAEILTQSMIYDGQFKLTLAPDAFQRAPKLAAEYPVDPASNRIPVMVPIQGTIFEITLKQKERIYENGRR